MPDLTFWLFFFLQNVSAENAEGSSPLHWACLNGHVSVSFSFFFFFCILVFVLAFRQSLCRSICSFLTPLNSFLAVFATVTTTNQVVEFLLDKGGKLSACNKAGRTPFDEAISRDQKAVLDYLEARQDKEDEGKEEGEGLVDPEEEMPDDVEVHKLEESDQ